MLLCPAAVDVIYVVVLADDPDPGRTREGQQVIEKSLVAVQHLAPLFAIFGVTLGPWQAVESEPQTGLMVPEAASTGFAPWPCGLPQVCEFLRPRAVLAVFEVPALAP